MEIEDHIFKNIKFIKSPNFNERPDSQKITLIVIHSISLPPKEYGGNYVENFFLNNLNVSDHKYFENLQNLKVSSHLYIKRDGEIIQFVPFDKRAWHAGDSSYNGDSDCNNFSIGIELEGLYHNGLEVSGRVHFEGSCMITVFGAGVGLKIEAEAT